MQGDTAFFEDTNSNTKPACSSWVVVVKLQDLLTSKVKHLFSMW